FRAPPQNPRFDRLHLTIPPNLSSAERSTSSVSRPDPPVSVNFRAKPLPTPPYRPKRSAPATSMLDPEVYSRVQVRSLTLTTNVRSHVSVTLSTERNFTRMLVPAAAERLTSKRMPFSVPVRIQPSLSVMYSPA